MASVRSTRSRSTTHLEPSAISPAIGREFIKTINFTNFILLRFTNDYLPKIRIPSF